MPKRLKIHLYWKDFTSTKFGLRFLKLDPSMLAMTINKRY